MKIQKNHIKYKLEFQNWNYVDTFENIEKQPGKVFVRRKLLIFI